MSPLEIPMIHFFFFSSSVVLPHEYIKEAERAVAESMTELHFWSLPPQKQIQKAVTMGQKKFW